MCISEHDAVIVAFGRSPIARANKKGALRNTHPVDLGGEVLKQVLSRVPQLDPTAVEDVLVGCAKPEGRQGTNMARLIASRAGCGWGVPGQTINRFCSSSLQAISTAANMIRCGEADIVAAGGVESMSSNPMGADMSVLSKWVLKNDPGMYTPMGITAENVAKKYGITRTEMDAFAVESHRRAAAATQNGLFAEEIIPLQGVDEAGDSILFEKDQGIRPDTNLETLGELKPAFSEDGIVTAGQSSQVSDGAAFVS